MFKALFRILFATFISWSICGAAVIIPLLGIQWRIFTRPVDGIVDALLDLMKDICGILGVLAIILASLIVPLLRFPRGDPLLHRPGRAWLVGAAVFPLASAIWALGLAAAGILELESAATVDWLILAGASALSGAVFAFTYSYLTVLARRRGEAEGSEDR